MAWSVHEHDPPVTHRHGRLTIVAQRVDVRLRLPGRKITVRSHAFENLMSWPSAPIHTLTIAPESIVNPQPLAPDCESSVSSSPADTDDSTTDVTSARRTTSQASPLSGNSHHKTNPAAHAAATINTICRRGESAVIAEARTRRYQDNMRHQASIQLVEVTLNVQVIDCCRRRRPSHGISLRAAGLKASTRAKRQIRVVGAMRKSRALLPSRLCRRARTHTMTAHAITSNPIVIDTTVPSPSVRAATSSMSARTRMTTFGR